MKKFLISSIVLFSFYAQAGLPIFTGFYHAQNDAQIISKKRIELVNTITQNGKNRLDELKSRDYTCLILARGIYECSIFTTAASEADQRALDMHREAFQNVYIHFEENAVTPVLTNDSESIKEYTYNQNAFFLGKNFDEFRMLDLGSVQKISLGNPTVHSFIIKNDILLINKTYIINLSRITRELILIESSFNK